MEGGAPRRLEVKEPEGGPAPAGEGGNAATPPEASREEDKVAGQTSDPGFQSHSWSSFYDIIHGSEGRCLALWPLNISNIM